MYVEGHSQEERKKRRAELATLKSLTVQSSTRIRYDKTLEQFWSYLRSEGRRLPDQAHELDQWLCEYLEHLWSEGFGRALASDTVAAVQEPSLMCASVYPPLGACLRRGVYMKSRPVPHHFLKRLFIPWLAMPCLWRPADGRDSGAGWAFCGH